MFRTLVRFPQAPVSLQALPVPSPNVGGSNGSARHALVLPLSWARGPAGGDKDSPVSGDVPRDIHTLLSLLSRCCPSRNPARRTSTTSPTWSSTRSDPKSSVPSSTTGRPFCGTAPWQVTLALGEDFALVISHSPCVLRAGRHADAGKRRELWWVGALSAGAGHPTLGKGIEQGCEYQEAGDHWGPSGRLLQFSRLLNGACNSLCLEGLL